MLRLARFLPLVLAAAAVGTPGGGVGAGDGVEVHRVPQQIDAAGREDVTQELQGFIDAVPDASIIELPSEGRYRVEGTLELVDRTDLTIDGNGATVFATNQDRGPHWLVQRGGRITVRDLIQRGANPHAGLDDRAYQVPRVGQHGFRLEGVRGFELDQVAVTDVYGDFVYVGRTEAETFTDGVWIHDSLFARNGRQGIAVTAGRNVVIERNIITEVRRATVDLEPNSPTWGAENIHIRDNRIGPSRLLFVAAAGSGPVNDVVIRANRLSDQLLRINVTAPNDQRRRNMFVVNNQTDEQATRTPMKFIRVDGVVVRGNRQPVTRDDEAAIMTRDVCGLLVRDNQFGERLLDRDGGACGTAPSQPPASPRLAGRLTGPVAERPREPSPHTPNLPRPDREQAGETRDNGDDGGLLWWPFAMGVAAGILAVGGGLAYRLRARRS